MHRRIVAWLFPALLLILPVDGTAQRTAPGVGQLPRTFMLTGSVRDNDTGQPVEMVRVDLRRFTGETLATAFTRSNGEFEFSGLARGNYYLIVEEEGFEPIREQIEIINTDRRGVALQLSRPMIIRTALPVTPISARELSLPKKARDAFEKGRDRLLVKKDLRNSIEHFRRAITEFPSYYEAYHLMGVAYAQAGELDNAMDAYQKSIELSQGKHASAHISLAALLCDLQKFAEAERSARRGVEINAADWQGHYHLARALFGLNRLTDAENSLGEAVARRPDFADFHLLAANLHIRKKDYPALLKDLEAYLRLAPDGPASAAAREMREAVRKQLAAGSPQAAPKP